MPTVYRIDVKTTRGESRGRYKVTLTAKEGTYVLSVPQTVLGKLLYQVVRKKPLTIEFGRRNPVPVDIKFKGIRPLGKTARREITYTPLRPPRPKKEKKEESAPLVPKIEEVTSAITQTTSTAQNRRNNKRDKQKQAVATAA
jgi:hypothetical protein